MSLGNALGHLTLLPIPPRRRVPLVYSVHYFPWIGAALGSVNILVFLAAGRFLPAAVCCLIAVALPQALAGWSGWRGLAERAQGVRTLGAHGFRPGLRLDLRGIAVVALSITAKTLALLALPPEWQPRAAFLFPMLGTCARVAALLAHPLKSETRSPVLARRRVRAGFLSGLLLFLVFLFPVRVALPALALAAAVTYAFLTRGRRRAGGLALQDASFAAELAEAVFLVALAAGLPLILL